MEKGSNYRRNTYKAEVKNQPRQNIVVNQVSEEEEEKETVERTISEETKSEFSFKELLDSYKLRMSVGIFLVGISIFTFLSLCSYLFSGMSDQSVVEAIQLKDMFSPVEKVENWLGIAGAALAHLLIYHLIGVPSLLIVPILFTTGYEQITKTKLVSFNKILVYTLFSTIWLSLLLGYIVAGSQEPSALSFMCGGVGLACAEALNNAFGGGTIIVLIVSLCIFVINIVSIDVLLAKADQIRETIASSIATIQDKIAERKEQQESESSSENTSTPDQEEHKADSEEELNDFEKQFESTSEVPVIFDADDDWETVIKESEEPQENIVEELQEEVTEEAFTSVKEEEELVVETSIAQEEIIEEPVETFEKQEEEIEVETETPNIPHTEVEEQEVVEKQEEVEVKPEPKVVNFQPKLEVYKRPEPKDEPSLYHQALRRNAPEKPLAYTKKEEVEGVVEETKAQTTEHIQEEVKKSPQVDAFPAPEIVTAKDQLPYPEAEEVKPTESVNPSTDTRTSTSVEIESHGLMPIEEEKSTEIVSHGLMPVVEEVQEPSKKEETVFQEEKPSVVPTFVAKEEAVASVHNRQEEVEVEEAEYEEVEEEVTSLSGMSVQHTNDVDKADVSSLHQDEELIIEDSTYYDPHLDLPHYKYPDIDLLNDPIIEDVDVSEEELEENKMRIIQTLHHFKIEVDSISAVIGPTVTLYEIVPERGVKISKIKSLEDDIALSLAAIGIRIIAPIPGKGTIGIEVPNKNRKMVSIRSVLATSKFLETDMSLPVALGRTISNEVYIADLAKMPHLLMAGATGQGKSVGINVLLASLLYKKHPSELKFVMIDPKKVELSIFNKIERQYLASLPDADEAIITDTSKAIYVLNSLCREMDSRYDLLKNANCRNLKEYNKKFQDRRLNPQKGHRYLPFIVLFIDELADLMMTADKDIELPIARLAQLARAIGIHLVVATQRPSVDVITGKIKANFPARLSFRVSSKIDSRTILDNTGAEQLVGMGDMLYYSGNEMTRLQCAYIDTEEVEKLCDFIGNQKGYDTAYLLPETEEDTKSSGSGLMADIRERDDLFEDAARLIILTQQGSTSFIQRKLSLGYNRAGRIMDQLEAAGIVGPNEGSKARQVLIPDEFTFDQLLEEL